jgi:GNAT acetyltransferase-like protein
MTLPTSMTTPSPPDAAAWDEELAQLESVPSLLQTWAWGEVQSHAGWKVERLRLPGGGRASVLLRRTAGRWWGYVPRGPIPPAAAAELRDWARQTGLARLRVEPDAPPAAAAELGRLGFRARPDASPQQPRHSSIVPLQADEDELLGSFKPKTRYNIRLALKRGVQVDRTHDAEQLVSQTEATEARQGIRLPRGEYYRRLLELLPWAHVYVARHEGEALAAILVARHAGRAYYLFGGSSGKRRELMPMYAAQWQAMREAAADGLHEYDLWGVPPPEEPDHPWHGLMQFKAGFNGEAVEYCGPWESDLRASAVWIDLAGAARSFARRFLHKH